MKELSILAILFVIPMAYAEQVEVPFEATGSDCQETESLTTRTFACVWMAPKEFGISVIQEGLDELDKAVLEGIEILKANGERYPLPPDQWKKEQSLIDDDKPRTTTDWIREKSCESEREADKEL